MLKRLLIALAVGVVLLAGGIVVYVQFIKADAPAPLTFTDDDGDGATGTTAGTPVEVDGTWTIADGTEVGYRVTESFGGALESEAAGRTSAVTGTLSIEGTSVPEASFTADLTTVESDDPGRDRQFQGRIMSTDEFPDATFALTAPIELGAVPERGVEVSASATGELTLHGVTNDVTFDVQAKVVGDSIEVLGAIPVVFADYDIPNPSNPVVSTHDDGTLEFHLVLAPA